jgi:hypothetical protein
VEDQSDVGRQLVAGFRLDLDAARLRQRKLDREMAAERHRLNAVQQAATLGEGHDQAFPLAVVLAATRRKVRRDPQRDARLNLAELLKHAIQVVESGGALHRRGNPRVGAAGPGPSGEQNDRDDAAGRIVGHLGETPLVGDPEIRRSTLAVPGRALLLPLLRRLDLVAELGEDPQGPGREGAAVRVRDELLARQRAQRHERPYRSAARGG